MPTIILSPQSLSANHRYTEDSSTIVPAAAYNEDLLSPQLLWFFIVTAIDDERQ